MSPPPDRTNSRVLEVDRHGKVRWQFTCHYPVHVLVLPNNRVLVSEHARVTERDFQGNIHWQVDTPSLPYNAQRLPSGNTFVATANHLLEFDPAGKTVFDHRTVEEIVAGVKLPDGQTACLERATGRCIRLDESGKPVKSFVSGHSGVSGCVLELTRRGGLLVSRCEQSMAEEFDLEGKSLWRTPGPIAPGIVTKVRYGHLIVAAFSEGAVIQLDRTGKVVWRHETPGYNP